MPSIQAIADSLSSTFTDERYPLGTMYVQTDAEVKTGVSGVSDTTDFALLQGERVWIFVKAASAISAGDLCKRNAAGTPFEAAPDANNATVKHKLLGVADNAIASGSYGWLIKHGSCVYKSDTGGGGKSINAGALLDSDGGTGAGEVATAAGTDASVIGLTYEAADATLADFVQGFVDIP